MLIKEETSLSYVVNPFIEELDDIDEGGEDDYFESLLSESDESYSKRMWSFKVFIIFIMLSILDD